jgi:hypothetical protein
MLFRKAPHRDNGERITTRVVRPRDETHAPRSARLARQGIGSEVAMKRKKGVPGEDFGGLPDDELDDLEDDEEDADEDLYGDDEELDDDELDDDEEGFEDEYEEEEYDEDELDDLDDDAEER